MGNDRVLLAVFAHPDDESLGAGSTIAMYTASGVDVHLVCATRGDRGRYFDNSQRPADEEVGHVREQELRDAAEILGISSVDVLGYRDGEVDRAEPAELVRRIARSIRKHRPQVVLTFDPSGGYGHPDHIAISQLTTTAIAVAADAGADQVEGAPHAVLKLYYITETARTWAAFEKTFNRRLGTTVDGQWREATPWPDWAVTTRLDTGEHWRTAWRAVECHRTQMAIYGRLDEIPEAVLEELWREKAFYRAMSRVNGGRDIERDLFEGVMSRTAKGFQS